MKDIINEANRYMSEEELEKYANDEYVVVIFNQFENRDILATKAISKKEAEETLKTLDGVKDIWNPRIVLITDLSKELMDKVEYRE